MLSNSTTQIFHEIVETIREPLLVLDSNLKVLFASQNFIDTFQVTREETVGSFVYDLGNQQWDIPKLRELLNTILSQHIAFNNFEVQHDFSTIGIRTMLLNARQVQREAGNNPIILLAIEDITDRNRVEELLKESEERFRRLFETANDGILLLEKDKLKIRFANPSITTMLGYSNTECLDKEMADIGFPKDLGRIQELMQKLKSDGIMHYKDAPVKKKTGQVFDTDIYFVDKTNLIQCNIRDITERKRMEQKLLESEERYRLLTQNSLTGIYIHVGGLVKFVNRRFAEMLAYSPEEIVGRQYWDFVHPEDREMVKSVSLARARGEQAPPEYEFRHQSKDGKTLWVHNLPTIINYQGQTATMGNLAFIDDRKRAEKERVKLEAQFHQAQKMESVGRLAGGVAHDYNNMLSVIIGYTELALEKMASTEPIYGDLQEIYAAARRAEEITRQLLAFARQQTIAPTVLDLNTTLEGMLKMLRRLIGEDIHLTWLPHPDLWPVKMDPSQLDQILANLCVNARDAITYGGKISVETRNVTLDGAYCAGHRGFVPGDFVMLAVSDDGCGIDREKQEKIFEPFFTTKEVGKGTGLGLATVYGIVKQNNGFINVYSEPGTGTTFKIYLPRYDGMITDAMEEKTKPIPKGRGEWVLVVEDNDSVLKLAEKMLTGLGYTVLTAKNRGEAMDLVKRHTQQIQLLIVDVVMPEMNGRELTNQILGLCPNVQALFMSGYTADVIAHHGVLEEGVNFIQKPFTTHGIASAVRKVLDESKTLTQE
ncbi:PAS domain S-box protein [uncultured Desulfosarcina sp.]|uniref:PAS domain-containing hybrid sensor histidine kinase/response regulator n=1 Tax=uncultured Desulfosarcina sp. TaxID=218289 RepID=UPI0029C9926C|nr:PAS domain S-box protein [uncultured Desulfosarcina sp.]